MGQLRTIHARGLGVPSRAEDREFLNRFASMAGPRATTVTATRQDEWRWTLPSFEPARQEADELGPEPPGTGADLWRQERWVAEVLLAGLADEDVVLLRQAANGVANRVD